MEQEYLTVAEVAQRLKWSPKTVKNKMAAGTFQRGVHYFSPPGIRPRFKWSAVVAWLEGQTAAAVDDQNESDRIPMARGYYLAAARPGEKISSSS